MIQERELRRAAPLLVCLLIVFSLGSASAPAAGTTTVSDGGSAELSQQTTPENNSTVVHENPDNASTSGELEDVRRWLADRMGNAIIDCTEQVSAGSSYACERLDRDYPDWASQYVEVQRQSDVGTSENTDRTLNRTRANAQTFAEQVERFRELRSEYEAARAAGNDQRARELAHQLVRQSREINQTSSRVTSDYATFANTTSTDLSAATETVVEIEQNTTTAAAEIREAELIGTTLSAEATKASGSFGSPLAVEGRLVTENGTAVSNRDVRIRVGNGTVTTETDDDGVFSIEYRPTTERLGPSNWTIAYLPTNTSLYDRSSDRVSVVVNGERATVSVTRRPSSAAFGDVLTVEGRVEAAGRGVGDVPVAVTLGGTRLATDRTNETGRYSLDVAVPADVSAGDARLVAGLPFEGRALSAADADTTVRIDPTSTTLSLSGNRSSARVVHLEGRLETDAGPLANRQVELAVNGSTVGTVRTGPDGRFSTDADLPAAVSASDAAVVTATYSGTGTNLESARAQATLRPTASGSSGGFGTLLTDRLRVLFDQLTGSSNNAGGGVSDRLDGALQLGAVVLALTGLFVFGLLFRRRVETMSWVQGFFHGGDADPDDRELRAVDVEGADETTVPLQTSRTDVSLLETARERFSNGDTDAAILAGYEAVRRRLIERLDRDSPMTHWELLRFYGSNLANENALQQLTEAYERAAFSLQTSSEETTRAALENAERLVEEIDERSDSADSQRN